MSYLEVIKYLDSFVNYEKKPDELYLESLKLERVEGFLRVIGHPQQSFKSVHVAGTKGKGSVCAFTAYILREAGYKVGLFTSPHLTDVRERIRVLRPQDPNSKPVVEDFEGMIPKKDFTDLVTRLRPRIDKYCEISQYGPLTFFEIYTILAFEYFKEQKVDFAVLETGMGGRLDATNVVKPVICGITSISYDHTNKLGNTLAEIATEKAGIIKGEAVTVISAPQEEEVIKVLRKKCEESGAVLYEINKDIKFELISLNIDHQEFNIRGSLGRFNNLKIKLLGSHQLFNATLAVSLVAGIFMNSREHFKGGVFKKGLQNTCWPARFEIVSHDPLIILDGAHNVASARVLKETLKRTFPDKKVTLVLGISRDKDVLGITRELFPLAQRLILTCADNSRAARPADILSTGKEFLTDQKAEITRSVLEALKIVRSNPGRDILVLVAGSLFVVGEARGIVKNLPAAG
ncbi:MAG: bifunctional folylpolyglutamate synthase/dihydrofolate synthase [Candidatus Omnitrophica bacterium]|nr:bifunctional folylpolyglutamate synthase/dihydrofolate synthase [Candidatus Omnitrophota bacterium]